ncbi:MAG: cytochrome C, partial [Desulfamplus sp.]|nr:cytochrome C [Desulfamplus sp.]
PDRDAYHHYFNGANFLVYYLTEKAALKAGDEELAANVKEKYRMAVDRLKAAADIEIKPVYRGGILSEIRVRVKNIRAGHNLTTSLTNIRQMWLEVTAMDGDGKIIMTTGTLDEKGTLPQDVRIFNSHTQDRDLNFTIHPWEAETFSKNDTIPPKGFKDVHYGLSYPKGKPLTITATLRYRQADQKVAQKLLSMVPEDMDLEKIYGIKEIPLIPVIDMVSKTVALP